MEEEGHNCGTDTVHIWRLWSGPPIPMPSEFSISCQERDKSVHILQVSVKILMVVGGVTHKGTDVP